MHRLCIYLIIYVYIYLFIFTSKYVHIQKTCTASAVQCFDPKGLRQANYKSQCKYLLFA